MQILSEIGNPKVYNNYGCSPTIVKNFCSWLDSISENIESIDIALYLFNNQFLYSTLKNISSRGGQVNIISIPLEGYDNDRPIKIISADTSKSLGQYTKLDLAQPIYDDIKVNKNPNLNLYIFPHMYLRSSDVKPFSRGDMPYSLHCKTFRLKTKNGETYIGLTSSNLAVRDVQKIEIAFVSKIYNNDILAAEAFYQGLKTNAIHYSVFDATQDYCHYPITMLPSPAASKLMFTAPFFDKSSIDFENRLISLLNSAKERIIVVAQHICSYDYSYNGSFDLPPTDNPTSKPGFLSTVLNKAQSGIKTTFISQTYADENELNSSSTLNNISCSEQNKKPKYRVPKNKALFKKFVKEAKTISNCSYYVNSNLHAKYIVVDDAVIITTCNFTPTQFIYLPNVIINEFKNMPDASYSGISCEVGVYYASKCKELADNLVRFTDSIIMLSDTEKTFPN